MSYLDTINDKKLQMSAQRQKQAERGESKQDIDSLIQELKEVQLASLLGNKQKPSIVLTDSTDLGEHISDLGNKIVEVLNATKADKSTTEQINKLTSLVGDFKSLTVQVQKASKDHTDKVCAAIDDLRAAITMQKPVVVPAPNVNLKEREVDFSPLLKELKTLLTPRTVKKQINLADYRAIDLDNAPDGVQYVGFQNSSGGWYILQNNDSNNTIRYYFGKGSYEQAWDEKWSHDYTTLSEAMK